MRRLFRAGARFVAGVDEVGRGAWAGPVAVGIAVVDISCLARVPAGVRDSKELSQQAREALYAPLASWCPAFALGEASALECDELGMTGAQGLATARALGALKVRPDVLVVDGRFNYTADARARMVVGADASCLVVAAASVLAKVHRDRFMMEAASEYPSYGFERNKGYASLEHRRAVALHGLCALHRRSWSVRALSTGELALSPDQDLDPPGR